MFSVRRLGGLLGLAVGLTMVAPATQALAPVPTTLTLSADPEASIWYTTDGSDPVSNGQPYTDPIPLPAGSTLLKAIAVGHCALPSPVAQSVFTTATPGGCADQGAGCCAMSAKVKTNKTSFRGGPCLRTLGFINSQL